MDDNAKVRRCRYCKRTLKRFARVDYCHDCYWARRCQACGDPWSTLDKLGWCERCKDYLAIRRWLQRTFRRERPPKDERAARIALYRSRAEQNLPLFD